MTPLQRLGRPGQPARVIAFAGGGFDTAIQLGVPETVDALRAIKTDVAQQRLRQLADNVDAWYDLALQPVDGRYARRMRLGALAAAAVVVLAVNADGLALMRQAWSDSAFRDSVAARLEPVLQADSTFRASLARRDSLRADTTAAAATASAAADSVLSAAFARRTAQVDSALTQAGLKPFQYPKNFTVTPQWVIGILLSTLLVSLGAPFWHDVLEGVLGLKRKAVAAAGGTKGNGT